MVSNNPSTYEFPDYFLLLPFIGRTFLENDTLTFPTIFCSGGDVDRSSCRWRLSGATRSTHLPA